MPILYIAHIISDGGMAPTDANPTFGSTERKRELGLTPQAGSMLQDIGMDAPEIRVFGLEFLGVWHDFWGNSHLCVCPPTFTDAKGLLPPPKQTQ